MINFSLTTIFQNNNEYENVVDLGKHLGFAIPASGLSFAQADYEEENVGQQAKSINKRKSMDTSTPKPRKRSKTASSVENEHVERWQSLKLKEVEEV